MNAFARSASLIFVALALCGAGPASAQVPPSAQEIAPFSSLNNAAHRGNVAAIESGR